MEKCVYVGKNRRFPQVRRLDDPAKPQFSEFERKSVSNGSLWAERAKLRAFQQPRGVFHASNAPIMPKLHGNGVKIRFFRVFRFSTEISTSRTYQKHTHPCGFIFRAPRSRKAHFQPRMPYFSTSLWKTLLKCGKDSCGKPAPDRSRQNLRNFSPLRRKYALFSPFFHSFCPARLEIY